MDYSKLSDQEINLAIANILHPEMMAIESKSRPPSVCYPNHHEWRDYCNNPADAWPIIVENGIGVIPYKKGLSEAWNTAAGLIGGTTKDKNPLRAVMVVFLMMQESANVQDNPA